MKKYLWLGLLLAGISVRAENVDPTLTESGVAVPAPSTAAPAALPPAPAASTAAAVPAEPSTIRWVHPADGASFPPLKRSFVYGWVQPGGTLTLNGASVSVHPAGGWLAMVDYAPGENVLHLSYQKDGVTTELERTVTVGGLAGAPGPMETLKPDADAAVQPGERIEVSFRGEPGGKAHFQVSGLRPKFPMTDFGGTYRGFLASGDALSRASIKIYFDPPKGRELSREAPGRVTVLSTDAPWVVEVSTDLAILTAGPAFSVKDKAGYLMYPPLGVRLSVTGALGDELRVRLAEGRSAWISRDEVSDLAPGTQAPRAVVNTVSVTPSTGGALIRAAVTRRAPFDVAVEDDGRRLDVRFYGATSNTDWIHLSAVLPWIHEIRWRQESDDVYVLSVKTGENAWWGYDARYDGGGFVLELRRPPPLVSNRYPLEGLTVAVDPGHLPDTGAVGITGVFEKDINLAIAERLRKKLEAEKARVVMIREGQTPVLLYDRPRLAWAARADVLISVHNNALPEGDNPFEKNGYGVYYYQPQSLPLAREIYHAYAEKFDGGRNALKAVLRNDGLHWGNLALPRTPQMPAVLTESAYMIYPAEEWWLRQPAFQDDCASAMLEGLKRYVRKMRPAR